MVARTVGTLLGAFAIAALIAIPALAQDAGPATQADEIELEEDGVFVAYPLLNDTDPAGGALELVSVTDTPAGTARIADSAIIFTASPDWNGVSEVTYTVRSANGTASERMAITVLPVNDPPRAADDSFEMDGEGPLTIDLLRNDTDIDGDLLVVGTINNPVHGSVAVTDGVVEYTPESGFSGDDSFSYRVFDPSGEWSEATVTITVGIPAGTATTAVPGSDATTPSAATGAIAAPGWQAPAAAPEPTTARTEGFVAGLVRNLRALLLPLLLLGLIGATAWIASHRGMASGRKHAVVLVGRDELLAVHEKPGSDSETIHRYEYSTRQIDVVGRRRTVNGVAWLPVSTSSGRGWVAADFLTEDVARATFENDLAEGDVIRELRRKLKAGSTIATSSRGVIDPEGFSRDSERREIARHATSRLAELLGDWRATFHIDKTASIAALRPPQLRNLHWISVEAPGFDPWQLYFEYSDGQPHPVAALPENVAVPV